MIKLGTIGTSWITEEFIRSAKLNQDIKITAVYSRDKQKAIDLIKKTELSSARSFSDFSEMLSQIDAIYIASPNGLHYSQAKFFLSQQKHVFLEKSMTFKLEEIIELRKIAEFNDVILMEAYKVIHLPQYKFLSNMVNHSLPFLANFQMNQYSSKMPLVKQGIYPPVFDPNLGKGSTYDILVYPVELAIALFGKVIEVKSLAQKLPNGVDLTNIVLLKHENGILTNISCSKAAYGRYFSEIYSDKQTLSFKNCTQLNEIELYELEKDDVKTLFKCKKDEQDAFAYETQMFIDLILNQNTKMKNFLLDISQETIRVLNLIEINQEKIGEY
ncbi:Gfo/Idh/MocA family oxidoreductase [Spiroplasma endosymbiont of Labia minor]|uniref:Gfo/Idh/MocA family protein n=1 Tax=Spiroplasma endosymbiont of Labia minor TaxID=3066305 RepID=UPI0030D191AD